MKTVKIQKLVLKNILETNKKDHRSIFLEAQEKYREKVIAALDKQLSLARSGEKFDLHALFHEHIAPQDYTKEYNKVLRMLELSVDDVIELTSAEFENFVQDKWNWTSAWSASNSSYVGADKLSKYFEND